MTSWSTQYATVSWVGNHTRNVDISSKTGTPMEQLTEPLTEGMMVAAHTGLKPVNWVQPKDIKVAPAFVVRNHVHYGDIEPSPATDLYPSWYVGGGSASKTAAATIDKVSGKVATTCTPAAAKEVVRNGNVASWNIDRFVNHGTPNIGSATSGVSSSSASANDDVHNCNDSPPTVTLTAPSTCQTSCTITATVTQGTHPLNDPQYPQDPGTLTFTLDGHVIHTAAVSNSPSTVSFTYNPTSSGNGTLAATVTDSVLYSGSQSQGLSYSAPNPISITGSSTSGVSWTGGSGTYTVVDNVSGNSCSNTSSNSCAASFPPGSTVVVQDSNGDSSSPVTISGP
jgi:hypothetical protein